MNRLAAHRNRVDPGDVPCCGAAQVWPSGATPSSSRAIMPAIQYSDGAGLDRGHVAQPAAARDDDADVRSVQRVSAIGAAGTERSGRVAGAGLFAHQPADASSINMHNPRAVFFNDTVSVGWVRGGDVLEVAALDARQGVIFYSLDQKKAAPPAVQTLQTTALPAICRGTRSACPGLMVGEHVPAAGRSERLRQRLQHGAWEPARAAVGRLVGDGEPRRRASYGERAGDAAGRTAEDRDADRRAEVGPGSLRSDGIPDALQRRRGPARAGPPGANDEPDHASRVGGAVGRRRRQAPTRRRGCAKRPWIWSTTCCSSTRRRCQVPCAGRRGLPSASRPGGPRDSQGRSLRDLDLQRRLFRYPCSYMIYTEAFDALPPNAREAVYARLISVLSGRDATAPIQGAARRPIGER